MTLEDVYVLVAPLDTWSMDDMERQRRARYQKSRGEHNNGWVLLNSVGYRIESWIHEVST